MPELAKVIKIDRKLGRKPEFTLTIDGEEFPWFIARDDLKITVSEGLPSIQLRILADRVEVIDSAESAPDPEPEG
jgi:hypothetical protein